MKKLVSIDINTIPRTSSICEPCVEVLDGKDYSLIWTNNPDFDRKQAKNENQISNSLVKLKTYKVN